MIFCDIFADVLFLFFFVYLLSDDPDVSFWFLACYGNDNMTVAIHMTEVTRKNQRYTNSRDHCNNIHVLL